MKFSDIAGHNEAKEALRLMVKNNKIPHAILFSGISGIGKYRLARAFAQYIHCRNKTDGEPCGKCPSCLQHQKLNNPDIHFVFPIMKRDGALVSKDYFDKWKEYIGNMSYMPPEKWNEYINAGNSQPAIMVSESEDIIYRASLSPYQENYKIFLIWQPEKLRIEAANKLLKIIEEPYEDTIFLLVSNDSSKILPTVFSRTYRINLSPLDIDSISEYLITQKGIDEREARTAARISEGSMAKAEELVCFPDESYVFIETFKRIMRTAYSCNIRELKEIADSLAAWGREKCVRFLNYFSRMLRENFIYNLRMPQLNLMTHEEEEFSVKFAPFIHTANVETMTDASDEAAAHIERNANAKIVLFDFLLIIARCIRIPKNKPHIK